MFQLQKNDSNNTYHFVLKATNGQTILTSEVYNSKSAAQTGIASVKKNSQDLSKFERHTAKNGKFYFNLKAANGQVIGSSQMYAGEAGMENGIKSVFENAKNADIKEV